MPRPFREVDLDYFYSRVSKTDTCWVWTGPRDSWNYGKIYVCKLKSNEPAHRVSYWLHYGVYPLGFKTLHICDNPPCVNPFHLWLGTHEDNMADMVIKGRSAKGDRSPTRLNPQNICRGDRNGRRTHPERNARGEKSGRVKLTWEKVSEIRLLYANGDITTRELGERYGVSHSNIVALLNGKNWKEEWRPKKMNILMVAPWYSANPVRFLSDAFERIGFNVFRVGAVYRRHGNIDWDNDIVQPQLELVREAPIWDLNKYVDVATKFGYPPDLLYLSEENYQADILMTRKIPIALHLWDGWPQNYIRGEELNPTVKFTNHPRGIRIHPLTEDRPGWIYLPAAYAPWAHPFTNQERDIDFVLHASQYGKRKEMCDYLRSTGLAVADGWVNTAQYAVDYNRGLFTYHNTGGQYEVKFRMFEAAGMGCVNFSDHTDLLLRNDFWGYEHYIPINSYQDETGDFWPDFKEMADTIWSIKNDRRFMETTESISRDARKLVCFAHTYYDRAERILRELGFDDAANRTGETKEREGFWSE